jgi:hypothetical protein
LRKGKREVCTLPGLHALDESSRRVAEDELAERYLIAAVTRVRSVRIEFGRRYFDVETDRGARTFLLTDPNRHALSLPPDRLLLRDSMGNRYEVASVGALDGRSRALLARALW